MAFTPERKIILVKLRYARGWRLPGGGRRPGESAEEAGLRELGEEIGLVAHGRVHLACELEQRIDFKHDLSTVLLVEDVRYEPGWSWEIERVGEYALDELPRDTASTTHDWIAAVRHLI